MTLIKTPYDKNHYRVSPADRLGIIQRFLPEKKRGKDNKLIPYHSRQYLYIEELVKIGKKFLGQIEDQHHNISSLSNRIAGLKNLLRRCELENEVTKQNRKRLAKKYRDLSRKKRETKRVPDFLCVVCNVNTMPAILRTNICGDCLEKRNEKTIAP